MIKTNWRGLAPTLIRHPFLNLIMNRIHDIKYRGRKKKEKNEIKFLDLDIFKWKQWSKRSIQISHFLAPLSFHISSHDLLVPTTSILCIIARSEHYFLSRALFHIFGKIITYFQWSMTQDQILLNYMHKRWEGRRFQTTHSLVVKGRLYSSYILFNSKLPSVWSGATIRRYAC